MKLEHYLLIISALSGLALGAILIATPHKPRPEFMVLAGAYFFLTGVTDLLKFIIKRRYKNNQ